jgi:lysylphosphatidylglycerol synthetase-like protein (DUF2156 family)
MKIRAAHLAIGVAALDLIQLAIIQQIRWSAVAGALLYLVLAFGLARQHRGAKWVAMMTPIVPLVAAFAGATTVWTWFIYPLQIGTAWLAFRSDRRP